MTNKSQEENQNKVRVKIPIFSMTMTFISKLISVMFTAFFLAILIESVMTFAFSDEKDRAKKIFEKQYEFISVHNERWIDIESLLMDFHEKISGINPVGQFENNLNELNRGFIDLSDLKNEYNISNEITDTFKFIKSVFYYTSLSWLLKCLLTISFLPIFLSTWLAFSVDGFVQRKIDTHKGIRDSEDWFKIHLRILNTSTYGCVFFYIAIPHTVNPMLWMIPAILISSISVRYTFRYFKKYM